MITPDPARIFRDACVRVKRPFVDLMGRLARSAGSPEWWTLPFSSKSHYLSPLFYNVAAFDMVRSYAAAHPDIPLFIVTETPHQAGCLDAHFSSRGWNVRRYRGRPRWSIRWMWKDIVRFIGPRLRFLRDEVMKRRHLRGAGNSLPGRDEHITLIRTWFFSTSGLNGRFSDVYFEGLASSLRSAGRSPRIAITLQRADDAPRLKKFLSASPDQLAIDQLVGIGDVLRILLRTMRPPALSVSEARLGAADVLPLIRGEMDSSRFSPVTALALVHEFFVQRLSERGVRIDAVYLPFENQPWEKWFMRELRRRRPDVWICGYQHAVVFDMQLAYVSSPDEIRIAPKPDTIVCNGEQFAEHFRNLGYPDVRVAYPLRYAHLDRKFSPASTGGFEIDFVVCTSASYPETLELIHRLTMLMAGRSIRIAIKVHSLIDWPELVADLRSIGVHVPADWQASPEPLDQLCSRSRAMIWTSTSAYLDALAVACPTAHIVTSHAFDIDWVDLPGGCVDIYPEDSYESFMEKIEAMRRMMDPDRIREFVRRRLAFHAPAGVFPLPP